MDIHPTPLLLPTMLSKASRRLGLCPEKATISAKTIFFLNPLQIHSGSGPLAMPRILSDKVRDKRWIDRLIDYSLLFKL